MRAVFEQVEEEFKKEHPFHPQINGLQPHTRDQITPNAFERLSRTHNKTAVRINSMRQRLNERAMAECSFKPQINISSSITSGSQRNTPMSQSTRVESEEKQKTVECADDESQNWFHPQINPLSRATADADGRLPIYERINELQRQKEERVHSLREAETLKWDITFQPNINPTSKQIAELAHRHGSVDGTSTAQLAVNRRSASVSAIDDREAKQCTFHPKVSKRSKELARQSAAFTNTKDFAERQLVFARTAHERLQSAEQQIHRQETATFQPTITPTSHMLALAKRNADDLQSVSISERLSDKGRTEELKRCMEDQFFSQFTFQPKLSKVSKALAKPTADLSKARPHINEELLQQIEQEFKHTCTFKPVIGPQNCCDRSNGSTESEDQQLHAQERARKLSEAKRQRQYEELLDCTFHPQAAKPAPAFDKPVEVAGIAKHLERQIHAKKLEEEKRQREETIFKVNIQARDPTSNFTTPQPFHLHTNGLHSHSCQTKTSDDSAKKQPLYPHANANTTPIHLRQKDHKHCPKSRSCKVEEDEISVLQYDDESKTTNIIGIKDSEVINESS
jgi:hypothetical protein